MNPKSKDFLMLLQQIQEVDTIRTHQIKELPPDLIQNPVSLYIDRDRLLNARTPEENEYITPHRYWLRVVAWEWSSKKNF